MPFSSRALVELVLLGPVIVNENEPHVINLLDPDVPRRADFTWVGLGRAPRRQRGSSPDRARPGN